MLSKRIPTKYVTLEGPLFKPPEVDLTPDVKLRNLKEARDWFFDFINNFMFGSEAELMRARTNLIKNGFCFVIHKGQPAVAEWLIKTEEVTKERLGLSPLKFDFSKPLPGIKGNPEADILGGLNNE